MTRKLKLAPLSVCVSALLALVAACGDDDTKDGDEDPAATPTAAPTVAATETPLTSLKLGEKFTLPKDAFPEDVVAYERFAFVSNWVSGGINRLNLETGKTDEKWIRNTSAQLTAWWALDVDSKNKLLFSLQEAPYSFNPAQIPDQISQVVAYNVESGEHSKSWSLPQGKIFNSMKYDGSKYLYLNEITPTADIWRIDVTKTSAATKWADGAIFAAQGFGHGGMAVADVGENNAVYTVVSGKLWRIEIKSDGTSGTPTEVALTGAPATGVFADGMTISGDTIYYAYNDAQDPKDAGVVSKLKLNAAGTTGTVSAVVSGLGDPSGVTIFKGAKTYLLINESRFGLLLGNGFNPTPAISGIVAKGGLRMVVKALD